MNLFISAVEHKHLPAFVNRINQKDGNESYLHLVDINMDCRQ